MVGGEYPEPRDVRSHLVLLGAGASRAACPAGDRNGRQLPVMDDFASVLGIEDLLADAGTGYQPGENFESVYARMSGDPSMLDATEELETHVRRFFAALELPPEPTIYDYLLLSLRKKDVVASFNWDPLLVQAYQRNCHFASLPRLRFLHGNVAVGYCPNHSPVSYGDAGSACADCGTKRVDTPLLFPIEKKDYSADRGIADAWVFVQDALKRAFIFTIFGYSAPSTDADAFQLLQQAWGRAADRSIEEVEIIDLKNEDDLRETWSDFIFSHHHRVACCFHESIIGLSPRRSVEQMVSELLPSTSDQGFIKSFPPPGPATWNELLEFFEPLVARENLFSDES